MSKSLVLPVASSLSGVWQLSNNGKLVSVELSVKPIPVTNGYALLDSSHSLKRVIQEDITAWRPDPDGISFLNSNGDTVLFLAKTSDSVYQSNTGGYQLSRVR